MTGRGPRRAVVAGFDGSPAATRGLDRAAAAAGASGTLIVVIVESELYSRGLLAESLLEPGELDPSELAQQARAQVHTVEDPVTVIRRGDPADELIAVAREHEADLIVIGRRGSDFAARVLMGSVAARIVARAPCDVLVVA
jgi:nucleotide-binding universal stress UspA family protein